MFNGNTGYSLSDLAAVTRDGDGTFGGNNGWWIIVLFLIWGWGGNGGWNNRNNGATTREEVAYGFDMNNLENGIRSISNGLCDGFYAMNTGMLNGFAGVQSALCQGFSGVTANINSTGNDLQQAINANTVSGMQNTNAITAQLSQIAADNAACCCSTQRAIEKGFAETNYNLATQECQTRQAIADSTRSIIDFLTQDKIASLITENSALKAAANNAAQTYDIVNQLKAQAPVPAYVVPNPYCNCGSCGC